MGAKRSTERMERLRGRFYDGMAANGITGELADKIFDKMLAFANFGFPESHSISFASLVYYSAWFKLYHPAAFCAALLNAQPMGFYSPQSLVADARRHGVVAVRGPDVNLGRRRGGAAAATRAARAGRRSGWGWPRCARSALELAEQIDAERDARRPVPRPRRPGPARPAHRSPQAEALATAGAFGSFGIDRRAALWAAGVVAAVRAGAPAGHGRRAGRAGAAGDDRRRAHRRRRVGHRRLPGQPPDRAPARAARRFGAIRDRPARTPSGRAAGPDAPPPRVLVGGLVTHRQRPATAGGVTFLNLEDESGMLNVTCSEGLWARYRTVALGSAALLVRGRLERSPEGVLNLVADRLQQLALAVPVKSRDFR